jgi:hypothetical protein
MYRAAVFGENNRAGISCRAERLPDEKLENAGGGRTRISEHEHGLPYIEPAFRPAVSKVI